MQKLMEMWENCSINLSPDKNVESGNTQRICTLCPRSFRGKDRKVVNVSIFLPVIDFKSRKASSLPFYFLLPNHYQRGSKDTLTVNMGLNHMWRPTYILHSYTHKHTKVLQGKWSIVQILKSLSSAPTLPLRTNIWQPPNSTFQNDQLFVLDFSQRAGTSPFKLQTRRSHSHLMIE